MDELWIVVRFPIDIRDVCLLRIWSSSSPLFKGYWWYFMWSNYLHLVPSINTQWPVAAHPTPPPHASIYMSVSEVFSFLRTFRHFCKNCGIRPSDSLCPSVCRVHLSIVSVVSVCLSCPSVCPPGIRSVPNWRISAKLHTATFQVFYAYHIQVLLKMGKNRRQFAW
jgi:hypothetical protein